MKKAVWLSFDLGVNGDYEGLYAWLDNHNAIECGDSIGFVQYESKGNLLEELKHDLKEHVDLNGKSRIYVIYRSDEGKIKGSFLIGSRKKAPWTGYGTSEQETPDEA